MVPGQTSENRKIALSSRSISRPLLPNCPLNRSNRPQIRTESVSPILGLAVISRQSSLLKLLPLKRNLDCLRALTADHWIRTGLLLTHGNDQFNFDGNAPRQFGYPDRAAGMPARLAEYLDQQFGSSVQNLRLLLESGCRSYKAGHL